MQVIRNNSLFPQNWSSYFFTITYGPRPMQCGKGRGTTGFSDAKLQTKIDCG